MLLRSGWEMLRAKDRLGNARPAGAGGCVGVGRRGLKPLGSVESGSAVSEEGASEDDDDMGELKTKSCGNDAWCRCEAMPALPTAGRAEEGESWPLG
jgi:hypothetical protein